MCSSDLRVVWLFRRALARDPAPEESAATLDYVSRESAVPGTDAAAAWERLAHVLLASNEFHFLD